MSNLRKIDTSAFPVLLSWGEIQADPSRCNASVLAGNQAFPLLLKQKTNGARHAYYSLKNSTVSAVKQLDVHLGRTGLRTTSRRLNTTNSHAASIIVNPRSKVSVCA